MIKLTRLNGSRFYLNADHIQLVEATPDTHILLTNGQQYVAAESVEEVAERAIAYQRQVRRGWPASSATSAAVTEFPAAAGGKSDPPAATAEGRNLRIERRGAG